MIRDGAERAMFEAASTPVIHYDAKLMTLGAFAFRQVQSSTMIIDLLLKIADFRNRASSHRGFLVGAGANAVRKGFFGQVLGYNIKPSADDDINIHAEDIVVQKTAGYDFEKISVLGVIGLAQPDKITGFQALTLGPCGQRCRPRLAVNPMIDRHTLFVMATPDFKVIQMGEIYGMIRYHDYQDDSEIATFTFPETPQVLRPIPLPTVITPRSQCEFEVDSSDWDETIGMYLIKRTNRLFRYDAPNSEKYS